MKWQLGGYFLAIASGAFYGIISVIILFISRFGDVPSLFSMMVRMFLAGVFLLPFSVQHFRACHITGQFLRRMLCAGVFLTLSSILIYTALDDIPASIGITLHYTYPLVVMVLSVVIFRARVTCPAVIALVMSLIGVVLLCDNAVLPQGAGKGVCLALISAVTFGTYYLWVERKKLGEMDAVLFTMLLSFFDSILLALYNLATGNLFISVNAGTVGILVVAGFFAMFAILTQAMAIKRIGSVMTSILGTLQPIVCTLGSALVLREPVSARSLLGSAMVLGAVVIVTLGGKNKRTDAN